MGDEKKTITLTMDDVVFSGEVIMDSDSKWSGHLASTSGESIDLEKGILEGDNLKSGTVRFSNGNVYEGEFSNGQPHGDGKLTYKNGAVYKGKFSEGHPGGKGEFTYSNGSVSVGEFSYIKKHALTTGMLLSEGLFFEGKFHGYGTLTYANGEVYEGEFSKGERHGHGKLTHASGVVYEGEFSKDKVQMVFSKDLKSGFNYYETRDSLERSTSHQLLSGEPERDKYGKVKTDGASTAKLKPLFRETRKGDSDFPESENVEYFSYGKDGILEKRLEVNYNEINRLLSSGKAKNLEDLVARGALVVRNGKGKKLKLPANDIKKLLLESAKGMADLRSAKGAKGFSGGYPSEAQATILSMVRDENLRNVRFSTGKTSYDSMTSFLKSMGIDEENLNKTEAKYVSLNADTDLGDHTVCLTVDLERIRKDVDKHGWRYLSRSRKPYILAFDSSRAVGLPDYKGDFGAITENLKFMNKGQQKLGSCWFHSEASVLTTVENPRVMEKMFSGETKTYGLDRGRDFGGPNEIMVLQMQKLQSVADALGVNLGEGEFLVAGIVQEWLIGRVAELAEERALLEDLDKRIEKVFEKFERGLSGKNAGLVDIEYIVYKDKITEEHREKLREEIKNISLKKKAEKSPKFVENLKKLEEVNRQINNLENRLKAGLEKFKDGAKGVAMVKILKMNEKEKEEKEKKKREKEEKEKKGKEEKEKKKRENEEKEKRKKKEKEKKIKSDNFTGAIASVSLSEEKSPAVASPFTGVSTCVDYREEKKEEKEKKEKEEKKKKAFNPKNFKGVKKLESKKNEVNSLPPLPPPPVLDKEKEKEKKLEEKENIVSTSAVLKTLSQNCGTASGSDISSPNTIVSGVSKKGQGQGVV